MSQLGQNVGMQKFTCYECKAQFVVIIVRRNIAVPVCQNSAVVVRDKCSWVLNHAEKQLAIENAIIV